MDELKQSIADLESQEQIFQNDLNNVVDDNQAQDIINELNIVRNKLSEKRHELQQLQEKEQQRAEVIEEKAHATEIPFAVAGIDFTELPAEVITLIDAVVKADRRRLLNEHAIELEQLENEHFYRQQEKIREYNEQESLLRRIEDNEERLAKEVDRLEKEVSQLTLEKLDAESKRDAAVAESEQLQGELDQARDEIGHLKAEVEDLKRAQEYNNRQTEQVTANDEEKASIIAAVEAVKKRYAGFEDWGSGIKVSKPDGSFELVKRKEFETEWQAVDVPSFRPEDTATDSQDNNVPSAETVTDVEPPQFQTEEQTVPGNVLHSAVEAEPVGQVEQVTREEFQALVKRVEALECRSVQEAA